MYISHQRNMKSQQYDINKYIFISSTFLRHSQVTPKSNFKCLNSKEQHNTWFKLCDPNLHFFIFWDMSVQSKGCRTNAAAQNQPLRLAHEWAAQEVRITENIHNIRDGFHEEAQQGKDSLNQDTETTVHIAKHLNLSFNNTWYHYTDTSMCLNHILLAFSWFSLINTHGQASHM